MKKKSKKITLWVALLISICHLNAQISLLDSIELNNKNFVHVKTSSSSKGLTIVLHDQWSKKETLTESTEVDIESLNTITTPIDNIFSNEIVYFDTKFLYVFYSVYDGKMPNPEAEKIGLYKVLSKYSRANSKDYQFVDSIHLHMDDLVLKDDYLLLSRPVFTVAPLAVEGGSCAPYYRIFDENLNLVKVATPTLPNCGVNNRMILNAQGISLLGQDALSSNIFSWCKSGANINDMECKKIALDSDMIGYIAYTNQNSIYISCYKKTPSGSENYIVAYSFNGDLVKIVSTGSTLIEKIAQIDDRIIGYGYAPKESKLLIFDKTLNPLGSLVPPSGEIFFANDKILNYNNSKIFIYELK